MSKDTLPSWISRFFTALPLTKSTPVLGSTTLLRCCNKVSLATMEKGSAYEIDNIAGAGEAVCNHDSRRALFSCRIPLVRTGALRREITPFRSGAHAEKQRGNAGLTRLYFAHD